MNKYIKLAILASLTGSLMASEGRPNSSASSSLPSETPRQTIPTLTSSLNALNSVLDNIKSSAKVVASQNITREEKLSILVPMHEALKKINELNDKIKAAIEEQQRPENRRETHAREMENVARLHGHASTATSDLSARQNQEEKMSRAMAGMENWDWK